MSPLENVNRKFWWQFSRESLPSRQSVHYLVSKLKTTGSLPDNKLGRKQTADGSKIAWYWCSTWNFAKNIS